VPFDEARKLPCYDVCFNYAIVKLRVFDFMLLLSLNSPPYRELLLDGDYRFEVFVLFRPSFKAILARNVFPKVSFPSTNGPKSGRPVLID